MALKNRNFIGVYNKKNILIADDDDFNILAVKNILKQKGMQWNKLFEAENGQEAVKLAAKNPIDVVIIGI